MLSALILAIITIAAGYYYARRCKAAGRPDVVVEGVSLAGVGFVLSLFISFTCGILYSNMAERDSVTYEVVSVEVAGDNYIVKTKEGKTMVLSEDHDNFSVSVGGDKDTLAHNKGLPNDIFFDINGGNWELNMATK